MAVWLFYINILTLFTNTSLVHVSSCRFYIKGLSSILQSNGYMYQSVEEQMRRLELERNSLSRQLGVLTEQVEAQSQKMREMEYDLEKKRQKTHFAEEMYQKVICL